MPNFKAAFSTIWALRERCARLERAEVQKLLGTNFDPSVDRVAKACILRSVENIECRALAPFKVIMGSAISRRKVAASSKNNAG